MSDDIENEGLDLDEASFDDFEKKKGASTLGDLWRDNPMVKIGVVVAAAVAIFGTIILFGGGDAPIDPSYVSGGSDITAPPGTEEASPAYINALEEENERSTETAIKEGTSSLPTPINPPVGRLTVTDEDTPEEDPLQRWRKLQEERLQREMLRSQTTAPEAAPVEDTARTEAIQAMAEAMSQQMSSILESKKLRNLQYKSMTSPSWLEDLNAKEEKQIAEAKAAANTKGDDVEVILFPAGEIAYAQVLVEANSDVPGPVLAQIVSGPLAGSKIIGSFTVQKELLTLTFSTAVIDGISQSIDAIALDPETTLPALATDVDHHYLKRIVLPAAAAFVEGMASAISESGLTTVTVDGGAAVSDTEETDDKQEVASGIDEAGQELREILDDMADETEITVRVETGTPVGVLFLQPVVKNPNGI